MRTLQFGLKFIQLYKRGIKDGGTNMNTEDYIKFLEKEIHTTIIATVDEKGLPVTCAIDIMHSDEKVYISYCKRKGFYHRLIKEKFIALTGN
mgnify:CR=1 FL=1